MRLVMGAACVVALGLQACATAGMERPKLSKNASTARVAAGQPDPALEAYRIFSENCARQYGWPFFVSVSCKASREWDAAVKSTDAAVASTIKALIDAGIIKKAE
jgi:hypothetical protein